MHFYIEDRMLERGGELPSVTLSNGRQRFAWLPGGIARLRTFAGSYLVPTRVTYEYILARLPV